MFRKFTLYLFLLLSSIGLTYDTQSYTSGALSGSAYGIIGLSTLIALCYILPGIFLVRYLGKRWQVKPLVLVFALIGGVFITGWIAGYANTISHDCQQKVTKDSCLSLLRQVLASRLVKISPIFFQICLMVFLIRFQGFLVELLVLYRLTGFTRPSLLWG